MRIVQLNLAADFSLPAPDALLDRYHTLTGWSRALSGAGAEVSVVQRFSTGASLTRDESAYTFVADGRPGLLPPWEVSAPVIDAVSRLAPDLVHVNGLMFPGMLRAIRESVGGNCAIVAQDHSGTVPSRSLLLRTVGRRRWRRAFDAIDACSFTARELARPWRDVGLPEDCPILEIPEASTTFDAIDRDDARLATGIHGAPAILWVGRAHAAKDPETMASAVHEVIATLPDAHVWVLVSAAEDRHALEELLRARLAGLKFHPPSAPAPRVHIFGPVPYARMPAYYSAVDILLSTSRHEGSGYAVIEAMACGATPCVTNIPAFRALVGTCGDLWPVGDSSACAVALKSAAARRSLEQRHMVRQHFVDHASWRVIGRHTFDAYRALVRQRRSRS